MTKQFELEQAILDTWGITDDLEILTKKWDQLSEDAKLNILIGLKELYTLKFETTFNLFEDHLQELANHK